MGGLDPKVKTFVQYVAVSILAATYLACVAIAVVDLIRMAQIPNTVNSIINLGLGAALTILNLQHGISLGAKSTAAQGAATGQLGGTN
jgi:hypothetical protein